jgi:hypothetical protein
MSELLFPLNFKRQYAAPLDVDMVFDTIADKTSYLTNARRYAGQIVTCLEETGKVFILSNDTNSWVEIDGSDTTLRAEVAAISGSLQSQITAISGSLQLQVAQLEQDIDNLDLDLQDQITDIVNGISVESSGGSIIVVQNGLSYNLEVASSPIQNHNSLSGLQGSGSEYYHLNASQFASISGGINVSNYTLLSTTASISGNLQSQITDISGSLQLQVAQLEQDIENLDLDLQSQISAITVPTSATFIPAYDQRYTLVSTTASISGSLNTRLTTVENNYATKTTPTSGNYNNVTINSQGVVISGSNLGYALASSIPTSATFLTDYDNRYVNVTGDTMTGNLIITSDNSSPALQINSDGDARIRLNNPTGNDTYSELAYAINGTDRFGIYCNGDTQATTNKFALYDYYEGYDFLNYVDGRMTFFTNKQQAGFRLVNNYYDNRLEISFAYDTDFSSATDPIDQYSIRYDALDDGFGIFNYTAPTSGFWLFKCNGSTNEVEISNPVVISSLEGTTDGIVYSNSDGKLLRYQLKPEDIATQQDVYNLDVDLQGQILNVMNPAEVSNISGSSITIDSFPHYNEFGSCEWIININNGTDTRASRVLCVYKPSTATINSTEDTVGGIGDTSDASITATIDATNVYLTLTSTATWNFKTKRITV